MVFTEDEGVFCLPFCFSWKLWMLNRRLAQATILHVVHRCVRVGGWRCDRGSSRYVRCGIDLHGSGATLSDKRRPL